MFLSRCPRRPAPALLPLVLAFALSACSSSPVHHSDELWKEGRYDDAVQYLQQAIKTDPLDTAALAAYHRRREQALAQLLIAAQSELAAGHLDGAHDLFVHARQIDPDSQRANDGLARIELEQHEVADVELARHELDAGHPDKTETLLRRILAANPQQHAAKQLLRRLHERGADDEQSPAALRSALASLVNLEFRDAPLRSVMEVLSKSANLNFVFDRDVKTDTKVSIFIRKVSVEDVLRVLLGSNGLERKVLNENTLLIFPNNAAKIKEYQDLVVRVFYLVNVEAKQAEAMLKTLGHVKDVFIEEKINMLAIRDTPAAVRMAERLIDTLDIADSEVMLEMKVVELSRTRALNLGVQFPTSVQVSNSNPITSSLTSAVSTGAGSIAQLNNFGTLVASIANPVLVANLSAQDSDANLLANPRIRVKNREKAKVLVGEKLPVITSTAVQNAGVASSVSYLDIGLKLEVEPQVYLNDDVGMKILLEVNSNLGAVTVGSSGTGQTTAYQVGTRTAQTVLRLHDGETQVLAGLINDNESSSWNKVPGLADLPGIGRLFSNENTSHEKTEIVLLVTPHIVRNLDVLESDRLLIPAGTDAVVGVAAMRIGATPPQSLSVRSEGGTAAPAPAGRVPRRDGPNPALTGENGAEELPSADAANGDTHANGAHGNPGANPVATPAPATPASAPAASGAAPTPNPAVAPAPSLNGSPMVPANSFTPAPPQGAADPNGSGQK